MKDTKLSLAVPFIMKMKFDIYRSSLHLLFSSQHVLNVQNKANQ